MSYAYDAMGRRTSKSVQSGAATQFLYDGANAVQETVGSTVNPILVGLGVDERFARNDTTGRTYFLSDALNSTIALTDPTGAIQNTYSYDPYGNTTQSNTAFTNPYQYTGREADAPGLYYYRARYYSPPMGGFISEDPSGFAGGQLSFTAYGGSDPVDNIDPSGLESPRAACGGSNNSTSAWAGCATPIPECTNPCGCSNGGALRTLGAMAMITVGGGPEDPFTDAIAAEIWSDSGDAPYSTYDTSITSPGSSSLNVLTNVTSDEFQANLIDNGYEVVSQGDSTNGSYTVLSNGQGTYTLYTRTSTGTAGGQFVGPDGTVTKFTLGGK